MRNMREETGETPRPGNPADFRNRNSRIVKTSLVGIAANVLLSAMKALIGTLTHSIAITLDAVNNLTDAGSSLITIAGTKLASRKPDKKHPFGHGRIEYLSAMLLGTLVMSAGLTSMVEAVKKIISAEQPEYTAGSLVIVGVCVLVKIVLSGYVTKAGKQLNSETLVNSGKDAAMDALISASTLAAALVHVFFGVTLESWLGALISVVIVKTGVEMQLRTLSELLGQRVSAECSRSLRQTVEAFPEVHGVYDLMLHDYGPNRMTASLNIEVDDGMRAMEISDLTRRISMKVLEKEHILLNAVGIYSADTKNEKAMLLRREITDIAMGFDHVLQVHGFYRKDSVVRFDIIVDFEEENPDALCGKIADRVRLRYPDLDVRVFWDADYSFSE